MHALQRVPRLIRFSGLLALAFLVALSAARLAFWFFFDNPNDPLGLGDLLQALYIGLKFDLRVTLLAILLTMLGVQLMTTGLLAEMVSRTYYESQGKPIYTVREELGAAQDRDCGERSGP